MAKKKMPKTEKKKTGPKAQVLKIEGDWLEAIGRAMKAGKPPRKRRIPARRS